MRSLYVKIAAASVMLLFSFFITSAQWVQSNGPWGANITCVAGFGDTIFAGTGLGLYRSTDNGAVWNPVITGLPTPYISAFDVSGNSMYVADYNNGLFRSNDGGATWKKNITYLGEVSALLIGDSTVFVGVGDSIAYRSIDDGVGWGSCGFHEIINAYCKKDSVLFAATWGGLYRSLNKGNNWENTDSSLKFMSLAVNDSFVFAGTDSGVFRSRDMGATWRRCTPSGLAVRFPYSVPLATMGPTVFAGFESAGVLRSTDNGLNWTEARAGLLGRVQSLKVIGKKVFAGTFFGLFLSTDGGESWSSAVHGIPNTDIVACAANDSAVFAATGISIFRSTDGGANWSRVRSSWFGAFNSLVTIGMTVLAATDNEGIYRSTDNGEHWSNAAGGLGSDRPITSLAVSGDRVFAGASKGYNVSTNGGASWVYRQLDKAVRFLGADGNACFATINDSLCRSTDRGAAWRTVDIGYAPKVRSFAAAVGTLFIGSSEGVFRSSNGGLHWTKTSGLGLSSPQAHSLAAAGSMLLAGSADGNVFSSTDHGETWARTNSESFGAGVASMVKRSNTLFAGTSGRGVWRWPIGGAVKAENPAARQTEHRDGAVAMHVDGRAHTVYLSLPSMARIEIAVFDLSGKKVASLADGFLPSGVHRFSWKRDHYSTGCYAIRIRAGSRTLMQSIPLLR